MKHYQNQRPQKAINFCSVTIARLAQSVEHGTLNPTLVGSRSTLAIVLSTESHYKEKLRGADKTVAFTNRYIG